MGLITTIFVIILTSMLIIFSFIMVIMLFNGNYESSYLRQTKRNIFTYYTIICKNRNIKPKNNLSIDEMLKEIELMKSK